MKYVVTVNGKTYNVEVERLASDYRPLTRSAYAGGVAPAPAPVAAPAPAPVPVAAPAPAAAAPAPAAAAGETNVCSPMPGNILDVKVTAGQAVKAGQLLLTLEAMKMENEIVAPVDGTVKSIAVAKGSIVDTDALLVVLG